MVMASTDKSFVTKDMSPEEWRFTEKQEAWLEHVAKEMPVKSAATLERVVAIELPDFRLSYAYTEAYTIALANRVDLVMPMITSRDQWKDRRAEEARILWRLVNGAPPDVTFCAVALPTRSRALGCMPSKSITGVGMLVRESVALGPAEEAERQSAPFGCGGPHVGAPLN